MIELYIVIDGGCVSYVSSTSKRVQVHVLDLDNRRDASDDSPEELAEFDADLETAGSLTRLW